MKEKERIILSYGIVALAIIVFIFALDFPEDFKITGKGISGNLSLFVEGVQQIIIHSPLNITYNFSIGEPYTLNLNTSAKFSVVEWKFSLYDLNENIYTISNLSFSPNTTFNATRWGNRLIVSAKEIDNNWISEEVIFYVNVPNSAPILGYIDDEIFVCESKMLNYPFNASDIDKDKLDGDISPRNPFYVIFNERENEVSFFSIISAILGKDRANRTYPRTISVNDNYNSSCCVDTKNINITVIEINNLPIMQGIGAQTIWTRGENSTFYHQMVVDDIEDGNSSQGNLNFNISFLEGKELFEIDNFGIMNYTANEDDEIGVYNTRVCVIDNPLNFIHPNITLCNPENGDAKSFCDDFSLTITNENRPPQIINWTPYEDNFTIRGTDIARFTVEVYDPDSTIPDIDWYVDGVLKKHTENNSNDSLNYLFGCDVKGLHNITITASDGLLNVSRTWVVNVELVVCPPEKTRAAGGGVAGASYCTERWVCDDWDICQNLKRSLNIGLISQKEYYEYNEICLQKGFFELFCGFQIRNCHDLNKCNNSVFREPKPSELQTCYFTEVPSCFDGIKNCHSGGCEIMVDCGGPCPPCPTCSDRIQNQGEEGIDCGGPCPFPCETEIPLSKNWVFWMLLLILILIILFIITKLKNIKDYVKEKNRNFFK